MNRHSPFTLRRRYLGSYVAIAYGLVTVVVGHLQSAILMAPAGELMLYGGLLYHARKRQRFESRRIWPALEVYAGLSIIWMIVNILRIGIWRWRPLAFGLIPALLLAAYAMAWTGKPANGKRTDGASTGGATLRHVPVLLMIAAFWFFLNFYALPALHITT